MIGKEMIRECKKRYAFFISQPFIFFVSGFFLDFSVQSPPLNKRTDNNRQKEWTSCKRHTDNKPNRASGNKEELKRRCNNVKKWTSISNERKERFIQVLMIVYFS